MEPENIIESKSLNDYKVKMKNREIQNQKTQSTTSNNIIFSLSVWSYYNNIERNSNNTIQIIPKTIVTIGVSQNSHIHKL